MFGNQIDTLKLQLAYDTKLDNATLDALKAFQLNTVNSDTSDLSNSKIRDIEASANMFFSSIAKNFNMVGYNEDVLKNYVPAIVYTMYDGYYIYSPYKNTLDEDTIKMLNDNKGSNVPTYSDGDEITGMKPYIYYSCRYISGTDIDVIITYSMDNYITVKGIVRGQSCDKSGYLLDNIDGDVNGMNFKYRGVPIQQELELHENTYDYNEKAIKEYKYKKINGVNFYKNDDGKWFTVLNKNQYVQNNVDNSNNTSAAIEYYREAKVFTKWVKDMLGGLSGKDAVDEGGQRIPGLGDYKIFETDGNSIEDPNSNFNQQRLAVIRYSIERNLSIAIANYNKFSSASANFQMPTLDEPEWDEIVNNISIISFLQGLSIGGKVYNGYSVITNNRTKEVVQEDSIYILTSDNQYHRANDADLLNYSADDILEGIFYMDFEIKSVETQDNKTIYYIPKGSIPGGGGSPVTGCYTSIVNPSTLKKLDNGNFYKYMENLKSEHPKLASIYFTALGRERYELYRTNNDYKQLKIKFGINS